MMKKFALLAVIIPCVMAAAAAAQTAVPPLTIEQIVEIRHPYSPAWSPDGRHIAFLWDHDGVDNLYVADAGGQGDPVAVTQFTEGKVRSFFWGRDNQTLYFPHDGDLWRGSASGGAPSAVWTTPAAESSIAASPDNSRVAFARASGTAPNSGADLVVRDLASGQETRVAHDPTNIADVRWSKDGSHLAYVGGFRIVDHPEMPPYSGDKIIYRNIEVTPGRLMVVAAAGGTPVTAGQLGEYEQASWVDAGHLVYDHQENQYKTRIIYVANASGGGPRVAHRDVEEKFWSIPEDSGSPGQASPDGKWILFISDRDGWDHLYVVPAAGGQAVQLTRGEFEAWRPQWSHDSRRIAFDANEPGHPGDRHLGIVDLSAGPERATVTMITAGRGTDTAPQWSPDDSRLVYQHTDPQHSADLYVMEARQGGKPAQISESMPAEVRKHTFVEPQFIHYAGPDGKQVGAWLFVPKNLDPSKKHAAIVWIHGDGINQNYDGWHIERNYAVYYSFHQYLLEKGYVVIAPDYRGSLGYGRDWRTGVYMDIGGNDAKDAYMAANYLKTLHYVDPDRIGVWGLSYGGFFTLISLTDNPTWFRCGVDVAGVVDFGMYYQDPYHNGWTVSRIGLPSQNPKVYEQTAVIHRMDQLQRPLLILHGTPDVNVPYLESVRLIDQLLKLGKDDLFSFMVYPGEYHYFDRGHILRDAWHRVDHFFEVNLEHDKGGQESQSRRAAP
ncbi:MAG TPA: prolyl oligopeptidase family serine peptidase [Terriglobales bacterium]|nr:prolyl oligopeptidase family serine peptidase [Terriglobales bacterium]